MRSPIDALVQRPSQEDVVVYSATAATVERHDAITWEIKDFLIQYDVLTTDPQTMASMQRESRYFTDVPRVSFESVEDGKMVTSNSVPVPPGTKVVILSWVWSDHVFHKPTSNKPLSARFHFPPNATHVWVGFQGEKGELFEHGFDELGTSKAAVSITSQEYFNKLIQSGLYSKEFNKLFPKTPTRGYDQSIIIDMTAKKLDVNSKLLVLVKYNDTMSLAQYYLCSVQVQQYEYVYRHGEKLKCTLLV
jgi:hypothetical protein